MYYIFHAEISQCLFLGTDPEIMLTVIEQAHYIPMM